jgi:hypothetical protein
MRLDELRRELVCIASEAETREELIGALQELLRRADEPENGPQEAAVAEIRAAVA